MRSPGDFNIGHGCIESKTDLYFFTDFFSHYLHVSAMTSSVMPKHSQGVQRDPQQRAEESTPPGIFSVQNWLKWIYLLYKISGLRYCVVAMENTLTQQFLWLLSALFHSHCCCLVQFLLTGALHQYPNNPFSAFIVLYTDGQVILIKSLPRVKTKISESVDHIPAISDTTINFLFHLSTLSNPCAL